MVNKKFYEVISGSYKLMSRFTFQIDGDSVKDLGLIATMGRRYQKIEIINLYRHQTDVVKLGLETVACETTDVKIETSEAPLSCFPSVTKLQIIGSFRCTEEFDPSLLAQLKHLKLGYDSNVSAI